MKRAPERSSGLAQRLAGALLLWFSGLACRDAYSPAQDAPAQASLGAVLLCVLVGPLTVALLVAGSAMLLSLERRWWHQAWAFGACIAWYLWVFLVS